MEQAPLYDVIANCHYDPNGTGGEKGFYLRIDRSDNNDIAYANWWWWNETKGGLSEEGRKAFGSVSTHRCPTRRGSALGLYMGDPGDSTDLPGPLGDYAAVIHSYFINTDGTTVTRSGSWWNAHNEYNGNAPADFSGPFRVAKVRDGVATNASGGPTGGNDTTFYNSWQPRDTFAWVSDGLSNQLFIGEKHIPTPKIGVSKTWNYAGSDRPFMADQMYLVSGRYRAGSARGIHIPLSAPEHHANCTDFCHPVNTGPGGDGSYGFGSWHPGICQFLVGDGAVRSLEVTTPTIILHKLGCVNDGFSVTLQ